MGPIEQQIRDKLTAAFSPSALEIINESGKHAGHAGTNETGESHFRIKIEAPHFADMNRVARQRAVYDVLKDELAGPVHALSVQATG